MREHLISDAQAAVVDAELERQFALIDREVARIDAERMADQIETFAAALRQDILRPEDFGDRTR